MTEQTWRGGVKFNQEKATLVVISRKYHQDPPFVFMSGSELNISSSFAQFDIAFHTFSLEKCLVFLTPSAVNYIQISDSTFFGELLPCLGQCS